MSVPVEVGDEQFAAVVAMLPGRVLVVDPGSGTILAASPESQRLFRPRTGPLPGSALTDVLPEIS